MTNWMLTLVLLATPLMAQEKSPPSPVETDELFKKLTSEIEKTKLDQDELDRVMAGLREALRKMNDARGTGVSFLQLGPELKFVVRGGQGGEEMKGSWTDSDGSKGEYKLSSLGKGRYRLLATKRGKDGAATRYEDEGTLVQLRQKYRFLQQFTMVRVHHAVGEPDSIVHFKTQVFDVSGMSPTRTLAVNTSPEIKFIKALGILVRRPSKELEYHLKLPTETTWIVEKLLPNAKRGLRKLDLLTEADGEDLSELKTLKDAKKVLVVVRRGKTMRIALDGDTPK